MKNNKAFTLVEVVGVVAILSLILLVAVPSLTKTLKNNEQKKYSNFLNDIKMVADTYLVSQLKKGAVTFQDNVTYFSLGDLIDAGYVKNIIVNPDTNEQLSRDTRIKVEKGLDQTYDFELQPYYNLVDDYDKTDLVIHYDAVSYSKDNIFINNNPNEVDYSFGSNAKWTEDGMYFTKLSNTGINLNNTYTTDAITVSFNVESLEELGIDGVSYTYPVYLYSGSSTSLYFGFRKNIGLLYGSNNNTVFDPSMSFSTNKNYTLTFVQENLNTRKFYIDGVLKSTVGDISVNTISYNRIKISPLLYNLNINNVLVYNKALTDDEVETLYNLDKARFGE